MNRKIAMVLIIIAAGIWGWYQPHIFPYEKYGGLFILTAAVGGGIIGFIPALYDIIRNLFRNKS